MFDDLADDAFRIIADTDVGMGRDAVYTARDGTSVLFEGVYVEPSADLDAGMERGRYVSTQPLIGCRSAAFPANHPQQSGRVVIDGRPETFRIRAVLPREIGWLDLELEEG